MKKYLSISKQAPAFPEYLDFQTLRKIGIDHLQKLSGKIWTDYNLHDPGVTILEVLCYAITDLGYRNNLDIKDLLTPAPKADRQTDRPDLSDSNFFTPDEILTCNPVTVLDMRKRLIDIQGVRNAWVEPLDSPEPAIYINHDHSQLQYTQPYSDTPKLNIRGLYTVYLDLDLDSQNDAYGEDYISWDSVIEEVKTVLHSHRNLCEDFQNIVVLEEESIGLKADIELTADADAEDILVKIYTQIQNFLAPQLQFYTLQELLNKGKSIDEIYAGRPSSLAEHDWGSAYKRRDTQEDGHQRRTSHGFIDTDELQALTLPEIIYTSDLYQIIWNIPGVQAIRDLGIVSYINGLARSLAYPWYLHLTKSYRPVLGIDYSHVQFSKQGLRIEVNPERVKYRYHQQRLADRKTHKNAYELDLSIPQGTHYDLADHYSIHHDFPVTYGINSDRLPATASKQRKAQAKQLKGYLVFFDQVLANYLKQLSQIRNLFSWEKNEWNKDNHTCISQVINFPGVDNIKKNHTYVSQVINFPGVDDILDQDPGNATNYADFLQSIVEDTPTALERRARFLDHLLARFSETFTDYILETYDETDLENDDKKPLTIDDFHQSDLKLLHDKACFLKEYPAISRDRFRAFNYYPSAEVQSGAITRPEISGFQHRVARLLRIPEADPLKCSEKEERFYLLEHILLRPQNHMFIDSSAQPLLLPIFTDGAQEPTNLAVHDPYSFWISALFPALERGRFSDSTFRQFVERTLRLEAPAHVAIKIGWFDQTQIKLFDKAYRAWVTQLKLSAKAGQCCSLTSKLNSLVSVLSKLESVSPQGLLANPQGQTNPKTDKIILC